MIEDRAVSIENVSEYTSPGGTVWYDDQCIGWMLAIEPICSEVGPLVLAEIAVERLRARVSALEEAHDRAVEQCVEASCRLAERRQMMETAVAALSSDLDVAHQVTAALAAERDALAVLLREADVRCEAVSAYERGKLLARVEMSQRRVSDLFAGLRAATLTLEDVAQAGILHDQEWLAMVRKAAGAARLLVGAA